MREKAIYFLTVEKPDEISGDDMSRGGGGPLFWQGRRERVTDSPRHIEHNLFPHFKLKP